MLSLVVSSLWLLMDFLLFLGLGCVAGFLAGLFGIGGGMIIVPVLFSTLTLQGVDISVAMHMALATSLATIVVTGTNSALAHHKQHHIHWPTAKALIPFLILGSMVGVGVANQLSGYTLSRLFMVFLFVMSVYIWLSPEPTQEVFRVANWRWKFAASVMGALSAVLGVGGALFMLPFLKSKGMVIRYAIGTTAACGVPLALTGALGYILVGGDDLSAKVPGWSLGYVNLTAFLGIVLTSSVFSRIGAKVVAKLPAKWTKRAFAVFLWILVSSLIWKQLG